MQIDDGFKNSLENSSKSKSIEHFPSGISMSTICLFKSIENKHDVYRNKYWIKKFSGSSREHAMELISFKKRKMKLLIKE